MRGPYEMYGVDPEVESRVGVNINFGDYKIKILAAGGNNQKYNAKVMEVARNLKDKNPFLDKHTMDEEEATHVIAEVYADTIIIGWENVTDDEGNVMEFNRENVVTLLTDPRLHGLFADIRKAAGNYELFRARRDEEAAKK